MAWRRVLLLTALTKSEHWSSRWGTRWMAEGALHRKLVGSLVERIRTEPDGSWLLFCDGVNEHSIGCPPQLDIVRPDLYARHKLEGRVVIGEAKTGTDIENDHTRLQLSYYFQHLASHPVSKLVLAVPFTEAGLAFRICQNVRRSVGLPNVPFEVTGWM